MSMPKQKPGKSKQDYSTPPELLNAVRKRLAIEEFTIDLAASLENSVCPRCYTVDDDSLVQSWNLGGWNWLNPPFSDIEPWVAKAVNESLKGAQTIMLVPASVGANWWRGFVEPFSYQVFLSPRLTFVGCTTPYPKDCALLFYTSWGFRGNETWKWK